MGAGRWHLSVTDGVAIAAAAVPFAGALLRIGFRVVRAADKAVSELGELNRQQAANHQVLADLSARMIVQEGRPSDRSPETT